MERPFSSWKFQWEFRKFLLREFPRLGNSKAGPYTRTRTNTNPNDTEANAAGRSGKARALRKQSKCGV